MVRIHVRGKHAHMSWLGSRLDCAVRYASALYPTHHHDFGIAKYNDNQDPKMVNTVSHDVKCGFWASRSMARNLSNAVFPA
jgi:hypothetical protein